MVHRGEALPRVLHVRQEGAPGLRHPGQAHERQPQHRHHRVQGKDRNLLNSCEIVKNDSSHQIDSTHPNHHYKVISTSHNKDVLVNADVLKQLGLSNPNDNAREDTADDVESLEGDNADLESTPAKSREDGALDGESNQVRKSRNLTLF